MRLVGMRDVLVLEMCVTLQALSMVGFKDQ